MSRVKKMAEMLLNAVDLEDSKKPRDIVGGLQGRQMLSKIAQEIMKMLNYQDLVSAQQVSPLWRQIVVDNKLWKKLLNRLLAEKQEWKEMVMVLQIEKTIASAEADVVEESDSLLYKNSCHLIHQSIKVYV